ncbi:MAG TPA: 16S rRNA (cytidine(1402)-2'-O)-methyltransferase [Anaerolineales bacterium]|nr:16S rRNA (cytidine(1402)-2'-O)-methyltransferase [Anaerolineales bacterium]
MLYLVASPIGNLEDISARALRVLQEVDLIAAEDTRVTNKLLSHYGIRTRMVSYYEHNKVSKLGLILGELGKGDVALVSDAGTPGLNDPGYELVRAALDAGHRVSPIPGPASPIAALVASGIATDAFLYLGYLPRKSAERRASLAAVASLPYTLILLETPHRLRASLQDLQDTLGDRKLAVARELTKLHEEVWRGSFAQAIDHFTDPRGEFTLVVEGNKVSPDGKWTEQQVRNAIDQALDAGETPSALASRLAGSSGWGRRDIYALILTTDKKRMQ